jgi:hypothetical protein
VLAFSGEVHHVAAGQPLGVAEDVLDQAIGM